jgi:hypothetical protein
MKVKDAKKAVERDIGSKVKIIDSKRLKGEILVIITEDKTRIDGPDPGHMTTRRLYRFEDDKLIGGDIIGKGRIERDREIASAPA